MDTLSNAAGLVELGLTRYEARAYLALVGRRDATPAEIARLGAIPRQRAYDVLAALAERGVVVQVPDQALRYRAQPPDRVAERLIAVRRRELDRLAQSMTDMVEELQRLYHGGQSRDDRIDYVEVLRDRQHAVERVEQLWDEAQREVLTLVRPPYLHPPAPQDAVVREGIVQRAVYERSLLDDPEMATLVRAYADLGEDVRVAAGLPLKLTIVDERSVAFNLPDPVEGEASVTMLIAHHDALAATLKLAFETVWTQAASLDDVLGAASAR